MATQRPQTSQYEEEEDDEEDEQYSSDEEEEEDEDEDEDEEEEEEEEETAALTVEARFLNIVQSMKLTHLETAALRLAIARSDTHIRSALEVFKATLNEVCVLYLSIYISIYLSIFLLVDDAI